MTRLWGRVTVEGWVEQRWDFTSEISGKPVTYVWSERSGGTFMPISMDRATVVFSPEPVTFEDGDAIRYLGGTVYNRVYGQWHMGADSIASPYSDGWASEAVRGGSAVKLVPEANGD